MYKLNEGRIIIDFRSFICHSQQLVQFMIPQSHLNELDLTLVQMASIGKAVYLINQFTNETLTYQLTGNDSKCWLLNVSMKSII